MNIINENKLNRIIKESISKIIKENTFSSWFGNSVLIDKEGQPIKFYHGTNNNFDAFDKSKISMSYEGCGFNFTPSYQRAWGYGSNNILEVYLKAENPITDQKMTISPKKLIKIISEIDKESIDKGEYSNTIVAEYEPTRYGEKFDAIYYNRAINVVARNIREFAKQNKYGDAGIYSELSIVAHDREKIMQVFQNLGFDSVIWHDKYNKDMINTVIVFEPNQIKLTSNKTFNIDSNVMNESSD